MTDNCKNDDEQASLPFAETKPSDGATTTATHQPIGETGQRKPRVLLALTGSVAAIKGPELAVRIAEEHNAAVKILLTRGGQHFWDKAEVYNPLYWKKLQDMMMFHGEMDTSHISIHDADDEWKGWQKLGDAVLHIELRDWADILVVAPLSAHTMAKIAMGLCDDTLTCVIRAWDFGHGSRPGKPLLLAPAMNTAMWNHPLTKSQLQTIQGFWNASRPVSSPNVDPNSTENGIQIIAPEVKVLACGETGDGALASVTEIVRVVGRFISS
ncbi:phosphopantothenoylcysteine decarboxylase [Nitzschia inconspicua]|uniref:Phosphopantothenoylcysteine decarboxylase n=1 Tax=Nitzschia inconspicua TaxID=303405 RepID=A0A9K3LHE1_9STRA|nr:phosphopantothenoylcysteine decarboxylase [Nitzschia inconspicua]